MARMRHCAKMIPFASPRKSELWGFCLDRVLTGKEESCAFSTSMS